MKGFEELWATLGDGPESLALVVGENAGSFIDAAASWHGLSAASVSTLLAIDDPDGWKHPGRSLRDHQVLIDLEILYWPAVMADPLRLLRSLSRHHPLIALWPGEIASGRTMYSEPGRRDYYDEPLAREVVVRTRPISSPADVPYDLEITR